MNEVETGLMNLAANIGMGFVMLFFVILFVVIVGVISGTSREGKK